MAGKDFPEPRIPLTPAFKLVFISVLGLTVLSFLTNLFLVTFLDVPTPEAKVFIETCSTTYKMGFAAVIGLIGGKAL